jgi:outer membrane protein assembly factor BamB
MVFRSSVALFALAFGACACASAAPGDDWPCWGGGPGRNMVSAQRGLVGTFGAGLDGNSGGINVAALRNIRWVAALGGQTYTSPVVAGGKVYIGTSDRGWGGALLCLEERTGRLLWRLRVPKSRHRFSGSNFDDFAAGLCSTPTVEGGRVYLVTNRAEVLCLDANGLADGNQRPFLDEQGCLADPNAEAGAPHRAGEADILWRRDMTTLPCAPHDAAAGSVLVHAGVLYAATGNGIHRRVNAPVPMPDAPSLVAIDQATGAVLAEDGEKIGRRMFHGQWSSPSLGVAGGRTLIFYGGGDGVCYAFEAMKRHGRDAGDAGDKREVAKLKKVWQFDCNGAELRQPGGADADYWDGDASRRGPRDAYVGPSEIIGTPVFSGGRVYATVGRDPVHGPSAGVLQCIDASLSGDITAKGAAWTYRGISRSMSTVAVAGGLVYAADIAGDVHCIDAGSGKAVWVHRTKEPIWGSPMVADGRVYVGTQERHLWALAAGRKLQVLSCTRLDRPISSTPVAANGTLYVASHRRLWAVGREDP